MIRLVVCLLVTLPCYFASAQDNETNTSHEIRAILRTQSECWNREDIDGFMQTYWKSEQLTFSSGGKTTRGWQATLEGYKERYPAGKMGRLNFDNLEIQMLGENAALVLGQWHLRYDDRNMDGNFSLVLRKLESGWKIVHDHSSMIETEDSKVDI